VFLRTSGGVTVAYSLSAGFAGGSMAKQMSLIDRCKTLTPCTHEKHECLLF